MSSMDEGRQADGISWVRADGSKRDEGRKVDMGGSTDVMEDRDVLGDKKGERRQAGAPRCQPAALHSGVRETTAHRALRAVSVSAGGTVSARYLCLPPRAATLRLSYSRPLPRSSFTSYNSGQNVLVLLHQCFKSTRN